jgi:hypothetical protein
MKLEEARSAYEALSGKASEIARQLCLSGIALIWLFKHNDVLDRTLLRAALFIFLTLITDLAQYLSGTTIWFFFFRRQELMDKDQFIAPAGLNVPIWALFYLKMIWLLVAYLGYIFPFLWSKFVD